jgi:hypothetical protein
MDTFVANVGLPFGVLMEVDLFVYLFDFKLLEEEVLLYTKN